MERRAGDHLDPPMSDAGLGDWEAKYQTGETPWDKGAPHPALLDFLAEEPVLGRVLIPGCGLGHDVRALTAAGAEALGIDIAPSAVGAAKKVPPAGAERYEVADLFALPEAMRGAFDLVWEHTCFCAIHPRLRPAYVEAVADALRPGGRLLAIFYLDPGQTRPDEGPPFETSLRELKALFLPRFTLLREWPPRRTYPGREGREWMRLFQR